MDARYGKARANWLTLPVPLRFRGADKVTVAPGTEAVSDPLRMPVARGDAVALTLFVASAPARQSVHLAAHATQFIAPGDQTRRAVLAGGRPLTSWYQVAGIDVLPTLAPAGVLVAIGDSITDGTGAGLDADERWTDFLARRLQRTGGPALGVINAGIGGNRICATITARTCCRASNATCWRGPESPTRWC